MRHEEQIEEVNQKAQAQIKDAIENARIENRRERQDERLMQEQTERRDREKAERETRHQAEKRARVEKKDIGENESR